MYWSGRQERNDYSILAIASSSKLLLKISPCCRLGCVEFHKSLEHGKIMYIYDLLHQGSYCPCMQEVRESLVLLKDTQLLFGQFAVHTIN